MPPPGLIDDPNFRRGVKRLPAHNLTFEAWIYHPQIETLTEVAREFPDVKIVLNHFGGPLGVRPHERDLPIHVDIPEKGPREGFRWSL